MWERLKGDLLADARQGDGAFTLAVGIVSGLIWLSLVYVLPGRSWWDTKFLVVAVCFVSWGAAELLSPGWQAVAAVLRATVLVFPLSFGAWILFDLLASF